MIADLFRRWLANPAEDVHIENVAAQISFNHRTKTVFMMCYDPGTPPGAYDDLEAHLRKQGYLLQIFLPSVSVQRIPDKQGE